MTTPNDLPSVGTALETALARIEDMLAGDDGQAFKEARKFLPVGRAALAAQPGAVGEPSDSAVKLAQLILSDCGHSTAISTTLLDRVALRITKHTDALLAAAPTEAKPAQQDAVDAEALRFAEMSMAAMRDALMPAFEYVGVSLRISQEDHAAIRSALAGMSTSLHMVRAAISAKKGQP